MMEAMIINLISLKRSIVAMYFELISGAQKISNAGHQVYSLEKERRAKLRRELYITL